ncbi:MAG: PilT/PilU family type 4a pilus ATPase [Candidatus Omnitrophica bacterium]|nr:PilT/PilU family type 4a pilus ATPase [Candidatus Omnitrophota bacterium]
MNISDLFKTMIKKDASDIHLKVGSMPIYRINKQLVPQEEYKKFTKDEMEEVISQITTESQRKEFDEKSEIDFAYIADGIGRFRVNIFRQRGETGIVMRRIKEEIPTFAELNLPPILEKVAMSERGIILVTGASSTGKSTTLASMINYINMNKKKHIMTLENPIEYLHSDKKSVINQREIGVDTDSFHAALKHIMRQDPDIIVIGEMRDRESVMTSISAAESGHVVLSSFHAEDTVQAIVRLLDFFPYSEKEQARMQLAGNLKAITCQRLLKKRGAEDEGLIPVVEILVVTPIVARLIRENKLKDIYKALQHGEDGMCNFNMSIIDLYKKNLITKEEALSKSNSPETLKINLKGIFLDEDKGILG